MTITIKSNPDGVSGAIQINGNDAVVFGTQGITQGAPFSFRNKIINGKMEIAQRGTSFAPANSGAYTLDRWVPSSSTAGVISIAQQADAPSNNEFQFSLRATVTTADTSIASTDNQGIFQNIEGYNVRNLIGNTFTLSFWVRSAKTGVHCVSLRNSGNDRTFVAEYTVNVANTWEKKTVLVAGGLITAGTWNWTNGMGLSVGFSLMCGSTYQTTAGAWQTGLFFATANQVNVLDTVGNIFAITGVQLEVGSIATPFEHRPYGQETELCERYFQQITPRGHSGGGQTTTSGFFFIPFKTTMRSAPTIAGVGNFIVDDYFATTVTTSSFTGSNSNTNSATISIGGFSPAIGTLPRPLQIPTANTGQLQISAEL